MACQMSSQAAKIDLKLIPPAGAFSAVFTPPGSKSLTNRALVMAMLAKGPSTLTNVLLADDTLVMLDALRALGYPVKVDEATKTVALTGGAPSTPQATLHCGNSGTTIRFLAAALATQTGTFTLDGIARMRQRPIGKLAEMLKNAGCRVRYEGDTGFPPITLLADGLPGGFLSFGSEQSSQFLSAILMAAPLARHEVRIDLTGPQTSWPYVEMTMRLMDHFGVMAELIRDQDTGEPKQIIVPQLAYVPTTYDVEPDASSASYFLAAAAIIPGSSITIAKLGKDSLQGDVQLAEKLREMGAAVTIGKNSITLTGPASLRGISADMSAIPDMAQTLAVVSLFASGSTHLTGLHTLKVKETDRIAALRTELTKLGAIVGATGDSLVITPPAAITPATIDTYDDHRMAMSFALAGLRTGDITIRDINCTAKTYPHFFDDFAKVTGLTAHPR